MSAIARQSDGLLAHWPLVSDASDISGHGRHGQARDVQFDGGAAVFDGKHSVIEIPQADCIGLGADNSTITAWVHTDDGPVGDILSRFDSERRTGFSLTVKDNPGAPSNQPNRRNPQFFIDCGTEPVRQDCGRPGATRFICALAVNQGDLYAAAHETEGGDRGHVFRYACGDALRPARRAFFARAIL